MLPVADLGAEALCHDTFSDEPVKEANFYFHQSQRDSRCACYFKSFKRIYIYKQAKKNIKHFSDPVMLWCVLWKLVLCLFVSLCLYLCMNGSSAQKALLNRTEIWQAWGGGGWSLSASRCPSLLCSPSCEDHVWHTGSGAETSKTSWEKEKNTDPFKHRVR